MGYSLNENPPKSPFAKGGLYRPCRLVPPIGKGGIGEISTQIYSVTY